MQSFRELYDIIVKGRPDVPLEEVTRWCNYLGQLKGCHLYSVASPEKDQEEWLRHRRVGIGGSEIASILGENQYSSALQVWMTKMGMFDDKPRAQSEAARWGNLLETTVATEWGIRENRKWVHIPVILQDDNRPWLLANIDGFTLSDDGITITGILEIKTTSAYNLETWEVGPLPINYIDQVNWYCGITQLNQYTIVCLVGGQKMFSLDLPADPDKFNQEVVAADDFWLNYVQKGIEPKAAATDVEMLKERVAEAEQPPAILDSDEIERVVEAYCKVREKIKGLEDIKDALYAQIIVELGSNDQALTKTHSIVRRASCRRACNFDLLSDSFPEAYAACVSNSLSTSFVIK